MTVKGCTVWEHDKYDCEWKMLVTCSLQVELVVVGKGPLVGAQIHSWDEWNKRSGTWVRDNIECPARVLHFGSLKDEWLGRD